jgi:hypothetical protein
MAGRTAAIQQPRGGRRGGPGGLRPGCSYSAATGRDNYHVIHVYANRPSLLKWLSNDNFKNTLLRPVEQSILQRQMVAVDPELGYAQVRYNNGVRLIMCVTSAQHDTIKLLIEELCLGLHINRGEGPAEGVDLGVAMQFQRPTYWPGNMEAFMSMVIDINQMPDRVSIVSKMGQRFRGDWGSLVTVLVPADVVSRILSNSYRLRGPCGYVVFYGRIVQAHSRAADCRRRNQQQEAANKSAAEAADTSVAMGDNDGANGTNDESSGNKDKSDVVQDDNNKVMETGEAAGGAGIKTSKRIRSIDKGVVDG